MSLGSYIPTYDLAADDSDDSGPSDRPPVIPGLSSDPSNVLVSTSPGSGSSCSWSGSDCDFSDADRGSRRGALTGSGTRRDSWAARLAGFSKQVGTSRGVFDELLEAERRSVEERDRVISWWCEQMLHRNLIQMAQRPEALPFLEPVPWDKEADLADYPQVVQTPIDLRTIGRRLEDSVYTDADGCVDPELFWKDVALCWSNCEKYFEGDTEVEVCRMASEMRKLAAMLEDDFEDKLQKFEEALEDLDPMLASAAAIADVAADSLEDAATIAYQDGSLAAGSLVDSASGWWQGDASVECAALKDATALKDMLQSVGSKPWPECFINRMAVFRSIARTVPTSLIHSEQAVRLLSPLANTLGGAISSMSMPEGVLLQRDTFRGIEGEWLFPEEWGELGTDRIESVLIWAHGGGFILCSSATHRFFLAQVVTHSRMPVLCVDYRKPPDYPFPTPVDDVFNVYEDIRDRDIADRVFLGGDSAGGNLVLSAARMLCTQFEEETGCGGGGAPWRDALPLPDGIVLLSPWVDLSDTSQDSWLRFEDIDYIPSTNAKAFAHVYANGIPLEDQEVSPGLCERWPKSFPPVLLDYGGCEVFRSQIDSLARSMVDNGLNLDIFVEAGMVHCYPLLEYLWGPEPGPFEAYFARVSAFLDRAGLDFGECY